MNRPTGHIGGDKKRRSNVLQRSGLTAIVIIWALLFLENVAHAQSICEATYKFDGNLSDASGNGHTGTAFGRENQPAPPQFGEGVSGQALFFDGVTGIETDLDLDFEACPQVTVTGWLRLDSDEPKGSGYIFSVGAKGPHGLYLWNRSVVLRGSGNGLRYDDAMRDPRAWFFFAGVYDFDAGTYRLQFRNRTIEGNLSGNPRKPQSETFFGARDDRLASPARDIYLDEVQIFGRTLSEEEIGRVAAQVTSRPWLTALSHDAAQSDRRVSNITIPEDARNNRPPIGPGQLPGGNQPVGNADSAGALLDGTPTDPGLEVRDELPAIPGVGQTQEGPGLDAGPAGDSGMDPGLTDPTYHPSVGEIPDTPPPGEPVDEIICEGSVSSQPTVWRRGAFPAEFISAIGKARQCGLRITVATVNQSGQWIVATEDQIAYSTGLATALAKRLREFEDNYGGLDAADIGEDGGWAIISGSNAATGALSARVASQIEGFASNASQVISLDFYPGDSDRWVVVTENGTVRDSGLSDVFRSALPNQTITQRKVHQVRLSDSGWLILGTDYWYATRNIDTSTLDILKSHQRSGKRLDHVVFGDSSTDYVTYSTGPEPNRPGDAIYDIEHNINSQTMWARMEAYDLPAISIAMVRNNDIAWARAYGIRNASEPESYTNIETTFDAASISKPIAAFALLQLVQDGKLSLTEEGVLDDLTGSFDILQRTIFSALEPATGNLVQLLQHCIDVDYFGANGAAQYDLNLSIPTTAEMITGTGRAKQSHRLVRGDDSGETSAYTSANFMLVQGLIDVHGGGFLNHMEQLLADLGMDKATYRSPYPRRNSGNFARGWDGNSVTDMWGYGEMAAASLVSRPIDIARFIIRVNELVADSSATEPLSYENARQFIGLDGVTDTSNDYAVCDDPSFGSEDWSLGVRNGSGWSNNNYYTHGGVHNGYRTRMFGFHEIQSGIVVFINSDEKDASNKRKADEFFKELRSAVINAYSF